MDSNLLNLRNAVYDLDSTRGGMSLHKVLLDDIHTELACFSEDINEKSWEQATTYWNEVQHKLRLLTALLSHAKDEFQRDFADLEDLHTKFFNEIVLNKNTKKA